MKTSRESGSHPIDQGGGRINQFDTNVISSSCFPRHTSTERHSLQRGGLAQQIVIHFDTSSSLGKLSNFCYQDFFQAWDFLLWWIHHKRTTYSKKAGLSSPLLGPCSFLKVAERCPVSSTQSVAAHKKILCSDWRSHKTRKRNTFFSQQTNKEDWKAQNYMGSGLKRCFERLQTCGGRTLSTRNLSPRWPAGVSNIISSNINRFKSFLWKY